MSESPDSVRNIERELASLLRYGTISKSSMPGSDVPLDRAAYLLLAQLYDKGPLSISVLADELRLAISTASRQISGLDRKGYAERFTTHGNSKDNLVRITPLGQQVLLQIQDMRLQLYAQILADWSAADLRVLEQNLQRLNLDLKRYKAGNGP